ncbi:Activator of Hsp90 ATPase -like protein [uncultured archaeon]|nr:Activator of Hsp90 ATPase -like protein [uncultured archaeon]
MKTIKQTVVFNASANDLYEYLVNSRKLSNITGAKASNTQKIGGKFSAWDDYIFGTNVELVPGKKIVQKWACADFPEKHFSDVTFELKSKGPKQTELIFTQVNVPDELFEDLSAGWNDFYWEPIKDYIEDLMWK